MKRIFTFLAVAALMAAMMVVMAAPAFADKDRKGHHTETFTDDGNGGGTFDSTTSGKEGNLEGGPGRTKIHTTLDYSAIPDPDATFYEENVTTNGHTERGGGKDTVHFKQNGDGNSTFDRNCVGTDDGFGAPGC